MSGEIRRWVGPRLGTAHEGRLDAVDPLPISLHQLGGDRHVEIGVRMSVRKGVLGGFDGAGGDASELVFRRRRGCA